VRQLAPDLQKLSGKTRPWDLDSDWWERPSADALAESKTGHYTPPAQAMRRTNEARECLASNARETDAAGRKRKRRLVKQLLALADRRRRSK